MIFVVLGIFVFTYALLIFRGIGKRFVLPSWSSMAIGALLMIATFSISPVHAFQSIDFRVISFLFGILVITAGFEKSGLIEYLVVSLLNRAKNLDRLLLGTVFGAGLLSAFLLNDGIALLVTPLVLGISSKIGMKNPRGLLLPLAFGITTGSTFTPIGNPQNLLVALNSGMSNPFAQFVEYLFLPSLASLLAVYLLCRVFFKHDYSLVKPDLAEEKNTLAQDSSKISDPELATQSAAVLGLLVTSIIIVEVFPELQQSLGLTLSNLSFAFGVVLLVLSRRRLYLLMGISWGVLIFFAGMFVVMRAVWDSNIGPILLSVLPSPSATSSRVQSTSAIMLNSVLLSQILSNVPFVQLYTYKMHALGLAGKNVIQWLSLAAGSTLAGNLSLLGAVSNIIIMNSAEERKSKAFSFFEFLKYGAIVTLVTTLIFSVFLFLI
ncbi:MAG: SLC13 family permease [Nitrososphaerales archaeon]